MQKTAIVIPNWNGKDTLGACLDSLLVQSVAADVIVVENGSTDGSLEFLQQSYPQIHLLINKKNLGFDGGVNTGIRYALQHNYEFIALFNNDAVAHKDWLKNLKNCMEDTHVGISTCTFMSIDGKHLDSTGDYYTTWGLAYPRGRGEVVAGQYNELKDIFGASGGASLFRAEMFKEIGIFDEDFFAYYEDTDISWRAQLAGWKVTYAPDAVAYHHISATSSKIKGFATYQTIKNYPWVLVKNVPRQLLPIILPRFILAYSAFVVSAMTRGQIGAVVKGLFWSHVLLPKKLFERYKIQKSRSVSIEYINSIIVHDLPPNAARLRALREKWWMLKGKRV